MNKTLFQKVSDAYINALENDYNLDKQNPSSVASDMQMCDADLESENYEQILECVKKIQTRRQING